MRFLALLCFLFLIFPLVSAVTMETGTPLTIGSQVVTLDQTGSDVFGNYALFSVGEQRIKVYEQNQKSVRGVSIYVDSVSDETGVLYDNAIVFINGAEKNYLGQRFGDYWYQLKEGEKITFDGLLLTYLRSNPGFVDVNVGDKVVQLPLGKYISVQGISLMAHRVQKRGATSVLTLRVHTLPTAQIPMQETTKVVSLGNLAIIQGRMTEFFESGKSAFSPPLMKIKKRLHDLKARFL